MQDTVYSITDKVNRALIEMAGIALKGRVDLISIAVTLWTVTEKVNTCKDFDAINI